MKKCVNCVHCGVCSRFQPYGKHKNEPCSCFVSCENATMVVRCKNCTFAYPDARIIWYNTLSAAPPDERILWCVQQKTYMPLNGFCSDGKERE